MCKLYQQMNNPQSLEGDETIAETNDVTFSRVNLFLTIYYFLKVATTNWI
mgnify:CR=1 FL=1